jgi:glc operon protein GlcG
MKSTNLTALLVAAALSTATPLHAQDQKAAQNPAQNPRDVVPDKMPFATPYGPPITLARAKALLEAAEAEATKRGWQLDIAVDDSSANLLAFARMDGAALGNIELALHKARTSVKFRRPTKAFEDAIQDKGYNYILTLDDVIASRGGIPLIEDGKIIGAIGCSGGTSSQDEAVCAVAAATINK